MIRKAGTALIIIGAVLILAALSLLVYNRWDARRAGEAVSGINDMLLAAVEEEQDRIKPVEEIMAEPVRDDEEEPHGEEMQAMFIDGYDYIGILSIPRFGLELAVMSDWSYAGLKLAPGRYRGSVWTDNLIICGHNYDRHFGKLKNLGPGDSVIFTDVEGNVFEYVVDEVIIIQPTAIDEMISGDWDLTLFTCTLGGRTRVTVRCSLVDGNEDS